MVLALKDQWIWDSWYTHDGTRYHGYFLKADKSLGDPDLRHMNVTQGHAVSDDLVNWDHLGTCLTPWRDGPAWDDKTTWTGSVVQDDAGLWHLFYTGTRASEGAMYQRIGHATSADLHHWERLGDGLCLDLTGPNAMFYEKDHMIGHWHDRAMRDPWVMRDPKGGWLMYFTARAPGIAEPNAGGAIGFATSQDLIRWELQPPVFVGDYGQLEVPQVFQIGAKWYCLFCTSDIHWSKDRIAKAGVPPVTGNHYLIADDPRGPWTVAPGFLDGALPCRRYAARIVPTPKGLVILGFADGGKDHFGGYVMDPEPVEADNDGLLHVVAAREAAE